MFKTQVEKWKSLRSRVCVWELEAVEYVGNAVPNVQLTFHNLSDFDFSKFLKFFEICVALHNSKNKTYIFFIPKKIKTSVARI